MANTHSAKKAIRKIERRADVNRSRRSQMRTHVRKVEEAIAKGDKKAAEAALKAAGLTYQAYIYPGTQHGFHNNSTPRYQEGAAKLAWERTVAFFRANLA